MQSGGITYISNAGVLLKINGKKILIDALCNSVMPIYKSTPTEISEQIIDGVPPFDNIDLMLITHNHSDHFDAISVSRFLEQNHNAVVISNNEVISDIRNHVSAKEFTRLICLRPELHHEKGVRVKGIDVHAISMIHDGKEYAYVNNLAYIIECGMTVLHLGDAAPVKQNYEALKLHQYGIGLLIANFPYIAIATARQIIKEYINPQKIAVVHLPYRELDRFNWINSTKKSYEHVKGNFIPAEFLEDLGSSISI